MKWPLLQQIFAVGTASITLFVLANLLGPSDVGVWAMASASIAVLAALADIGVSTALVQRQEVSRAHENSAFAINSVLGIGLSIIGIVLSPLTGKMFNDPSVVPVTAALSLQFAFRGLGSTHIALAQRALRFRALAVRDLVAGVVGMVTGIVMASGGAGVASFVGAALATSITGTITSLMIIGNWLDPSRGSWAATMELWNYSRNIFGFNAFKAFAQNADRIVIGAALGAHAAGLYTLARSLVLTPVGMFNSALGVRFFPLLSRAQADMPEARRMFREAQTLAHTVLPRVLVAVLLPVSLFLLTAADASWQSLVPIIWIMAGVACVQGLFAPVGQLMKASGRSDWLLVWSILVWGTTTTSLLVSVRWGIIGSVSGLLAAHVLLLLPNSAIPGMILRHADLAKRVELVPPQARAATHPFPARGSVTFINVKDDVWRAAGDGVSDDSAKIQGAIDAAAAKGGGVVYLPPGKYLLAAKDEYGAILYPKSGVILRGAGNASILTVPNNWTNKDWDVFRTNTPTTDFGFEDFAYDGNGNNNVPTGTAYPSQTLFYLLAATRLRIARIYSHNVSGNRVFSIGNQGSAKTISDVSITDCVFETVADTIAGNQIRDHSTIWIRADRAVISDNVFRNPTISVKATAIESQCANSVVSQNVIENYNIGILVAALFDEVRAHSCCDNVMRNVQSGYRVLSERPRDCADPGAVH
jgi:O-antigen/teichoic acid export membrane protein